MTLIQNHPEENLKQTLIARTDVVIAQENNSKETFKGKLTAGANTCWGILAMLMEVCPQTHSNREGGLSLRLPDGTGGTSTCAQL